MSERESSFVGSMSSFNRLRGNLGIETLTSDQVDQTVARLKEIRDIPDNAQEKKDLETRLLALTEKILRKKSLELFNEKRRLFERMNITEDDLFNQSALMLLENYQGWNSSAVQMPEGESHGNFLTYFLKYFKSMLLRKIKTKWVKHERLVLDSGGVDEASLSSSKTEDNNRDHIDFDKVQSKIDLVFEQDPMAMLFLLLYYNQKELIVKHLPKVIASLEKKNNYHGKKKDLFKAQLDILYLINDDTINLFSAEPTYNDIGKVFGYTGERVRVMIKKSRESIFDLLKDKKI